MWSQAAAKGFTPDRVGGLPAAETVTVSLLRQVDFNPASPSDCAPAPDLWRVWSFATRILTR